MSVLHAILDVKTATGEERIAMQELVIGAPAPDFSLASTGGSMVSLADYRGRKIVLFFYPKDNTSG